MRELVLLPGWAMPASVLAALQAALAREYRVTCIELPRGATLAAMADAALALAPPRAVWCGWSLGGMVAAQAALQAPSRVVALVTLATNLSFTARAGWPQAMPATDFTAFATLFAVDPPAALDRFQALQCRGAASVRDDLRRLRAGAAAAGTRDIAALRAGLAVLRDSDLRAAVSGLSCPNLWLYGEYDALVPAAVADDVARAVPQARVAVLPGASHTSFIFSCERVVDALDSFLTEHA